MKIGKILLRFLGVLLLLAVLALPLLALWLNHTQIAEERRMIFPVLHESDKAVATRAMLQNVIESVQLKGIFVSGREAYQELEYKDPGTIRWIVQPGSETRAGQVLGYYKGEEIRAEYTGILKERNTYSEQPYLCYTLLEEPHLQCFVTPQQAQKLRDATDISAEGYDIRLLSVSNTLRADGTVRVLFAVPGSIYTVGQTLEMKVYTGLELKYQMVLPVDCIYQKVEGEDQPWYVYQVTAEGEPIGEIEVELGYTDGEIVCINQLEMATYYRRVK